MKKLREKYGGTKGRETINRAIRAEYGEAGALVLRRLQDWHRICNRLGWSPSDDPAGDEPLRVTAYRHLIEIANAMEDAICKRWGIAPRKREGDYVR